MTLLDEKVLVGRLDRGLVSKYCLIEKGKARLEYSSRAINPRMRPSSAPSKNYQSLGADGGFLVRRYGLSGQVVGDPEWQRCKSAD